MVIQLPALGWGARRQAGAARHGQSLVEFALVLPILLVIIAGVLEVGNVLTIYNRVQLAAREGARFGAAGGADIQSIVDQASRESLEVDPARMSIWAIRPVIDTTHTGLDGGPWTWQGATPGLPWGVSEQCIFGDLCTSGAESPVRPERVLANLRQIGTGANQATINGSRFVVVVVYYEVDTILNLPFFVPPGESEGRVPVWAFGVFNQEVEQEAVTQLSGGCSAYPLAINLDRIPADASEGTLIGPVYLNNEQGDVNIDGFGFLAWNAGTIQPSYLTASCNSSHPGSICSSAVSLMDDIGFEEFGDPGDTDMHRGDWVLASMGNVPNVHVDLEDHRDANRTLRVILYDFDEVGAGAGTPQNPKLINLDATHTNWQYHIDGFAIVRIHDLNWPGGSLDSDWITFEFVGWDTSCGYDS